jgi:hypothetical protein
MPHPGPPPLYPSPTIALNTNSLIDGLRDYPNMVLALATVALPLSSIRLRYPAIRPSFWGDCKGLCSLTVRP